MVVGFSGSRYLKAKSLSHKVLLAVLGYSVSLGAKLVVGCCPSGADLFVRSACASVQVFQAQSRLPAALRSRTLSMVSACSVLFVFPVSVVVAQSGSWLSAFSAASQGKQVFVFLPGVQASQLPCCRGVVSWQVVSSFGKFQLPAGFFSPVVSQVSLFQ